MGKAVAKRAATAVKLKPIADVVVQIRGHVHDAEMLESRANKHRLQAGQLLLSLRQRIEAGEEGDVAWWDWFETQDFWRGRKDCERLMRIAASADPEQALEDERAKDRDRKRIAVERKKQLSAPIPKAMSDRRDEIEAELERRGVDYCKVVVYDAKQSKAMGGPAEPSIGWYSTTACAGDAAEKAFNEAVAAILGKLPIEHDVPIEDDAADLAAAPATVNKLSKEGMLEYQKELDQEQFEGMWDDATPEMREHQIKYIVKEFDPVALAMMALNAMDAEQWRRFSIVAEEMKRRFDKKRASQKPADGRDPTPPTIDKNIPMPPRKLH